AVVVGILILIISGFFVKNYYQKKKANRLLEDKNHEILSQKNIIETKQKEVLDSIHYAKKIQHALIDNQEIIKAGFKDSFTLYQPKDIVSGDFYWTTSVALPTAGRELFYLAVCDSTGHGVPGAFMSLLNISFLNEAINEKRIYQPNEIFNYVRQKLIASISKDGSQDGMDAVLFCFERDNNGLLKNITYSAANNNPLIIKTDTIVQLPADKMPVGKGVKEEPFKLYTAELSKDDLLYLYTDGFADQFGGPKGKKFKYKQLNDLLLGLSPLSLNEQNQKLKHSFETWRGPLEQLDDVCIIGIKI
ncbi:MAG: PP2C family protein-serine/threonine phosphatase, partial [Bacteroidia bacterium]